MPEAVLKFKLPEEDEEFAVTQNAGAFLNVLTDFDQALRQKVKYGPDDQQTTTYEAVRTLLWETAKEWDVNRFM